MTDGAQTMPPDWQRVFELAAVDGHSISWGVNGSAGLYDPTAAELDEAAFANDTLHCTSAGNSGPAGLMGSPATMKNALSVGACVDVNCTAAASFSSAGPLPDGRTRVPRVLALGIGVNASEAVNGSAPGYAAFAVAQGTSVASAAVCGLVAMFREFWGARPPAALTLAAVVNSARATNGSVVNASSGALLPGYRDMSYGLPQVAAWATTLYLTGALASNQDARYCLAASGPNVSATLAWMDPPAAPYSSPVLVNNLQLVISHAGQTYSTAENEVDNVVQLRLANASVGLPLQVWVVASGVISLPPQQYGLAISGAANSSCNVVVPCNVSHGSGVLLPTGCLVLMCAPHYQLVGEECVCDPAVDCGNSVQVLCKNNTFAPCPQGTIIVVEVEYELPPWSWAAFAFAMVVALACCGFGLASADMHRKRKERRSPPPPAARKRPAQHKNGWLPDV